MGGSSSFVFSALIDGVLILGGHGDTVSGLPVKTGEPDEGGGIGMVPIVGVILLGLCAAALLTWLNRQERESDDVVVEGGGATLRLRSIAPLGFIAAVIAAPLILWTTSSGGDDKRLTVERFVNDKGAPELLVSLVDKDLNTLASTRGKRSVRLECTGRDGQRVLVGRPKWPFIKERGYEYPHAHQPATSDQVRRAEECRLEGHKRTLKADVRGALTY
jgi:hypothetical protein